MDLILLLLGLALIIFVSANQEAKREYNSDEARRRRRLDDLRAAYAKLGDD